MVYDVIINSDISMFDDDFDMMHQKELNNDFQDIKSLDVMDDITEEKLNKFFSTEKKLNAFPMKKVATVKA